MKVRFLELDIKDFRQLGTRKWRFTDGANFILGCNGSGKTNTLHAITWCLFGKDMADRSKFEVIPLDINNVSTGVEPEVSLTLETEGKEIKLTRLACSKIPQIAKLVYMSSRTS